MGVRQARYLATGAVAIAVLVGCGIGLAGATLSQDEDRNFKLNMESLRYRSDLVGYSDEELRVTAFEWCGKARKAGVQTEEELLAYLAVTTPLSNGEALLVSALNDASGGDCLR